jgi:phage gp37-like protein
MYRITEIEKAIIARLKSQISYLRTCASLGDYLKSKAEEQALNFPAAYVIYERGTYSRTVSDAQDKRIYISVITMTENLRGQEEVRHGFGSEKGAYDLLDDVRDALSDQTCGLDIYPLLPEEENILGGDENFAVYGIRFRSQHRYDLSS